MLSAAAKIGRGAIEYANHMKGLPMYEPFKPNDAIPAKGTVLAMAVSSRGDTMRGRTAALVEELDLMQLIADEKTADEDRKARLQKAKEITNTEKATSPEEYEGKPEIVIYIEDVIALADCLSVCKRTTTLTFSPCDEKTQAALISAGTGVPINVERLFEYAKTVRNLERAFCAREGMTRDHDSLPKRFMDQPLEEGSHKGWMLKSSEFEKMKSKYYTLRGWDIITGVPTRETLEQTGLGDVADDLETHGKLPIKAKN
jgi:aldehyde:ferredoxin oxidoreductase